MKFTKTLFLTVFLTLMSFNSHAGLSTTKEPEVMGWVAIVSGLFVAPVSTVGAAYSTAHGTLSGVAVTAGLSVGVTVIGYIEDFLDGRSELLKEESLDYLADDYTGSEFGQLLDDLRRDSQYDELSDRDIAAITYLTITFSELENL